MKRGRERRAAPTRLEAEARARRGRAHSHYARVKERRATQARRRNGGALAFGLALAAGATLGAASGDALRASLARDGATLETIAVLGHERLAAVEVARASEVAPGTALAAIDAREVARAVASHPWVREATARHAPGGTLVVGIRERRPVALLHEGGAEASWRAVERDGTPFAALVPEQPDAWLQLRGAAGIPGDAPNARVAEAIALADRVDAHGLGRPVEVVLPSDVESAAGSQPAADSALGWRLRLDAHGPEIVLGARDQEDGLLHLVKLARERPDLLRAATRIDLRFRDRAVLRARETLLETSNSDAAGSEAGEENGAAG